MKKTGGRKSCDTLPLKREILELGPEKNLAQYLQISLHPIIYTVYIQYKYTYICIYADFLLYFPLATCPLHGSYLPLSNQSNCFLKKVWLLYIPSYKFWWFILLYIIVYICLIHYTYILRTWRVMGGKMRSLLQFLIY